MNIKIRMIFHDRIGIVANIADLLTENNLNIISMEVERKKEYAYVYTEIESGKQILDQSSLFEMLKKIPGLLEISIINTLPHKQREYKVRVVLDNISDGVISIDKHGKITTINKVARQILNCKLHESLGRYIEDIKLPDLDILQCLKGKVFDNVKKNRIHEKGRFQYFSSGRPILDASNNIIGAVEIMKDMKDIKSLVTSLSSPSSITFSDYIGKNKVIQEAIDFSQKIAHTDSIVVLHGESGTGKELFSKAIHTESERPGAFVAVNCAALPETLLESELFGYAGNAFTGAAKEGKPGLFELAKDGTIFLDEIAEMSINLQAKLLRIVQEQCVRRIGGAKEIPINARIITATNKNLEKLIAKKFFRKDLYFRINVLPIYLPPLRERVEDIPLLVEHFLFQFASKLNQKVKILTSEALNKLKGHMWPGNIRELRNVIERAALLCDDSQIDVNNILFSFEIGKAKKRMQRLILPDITKNIALKSLMESFEKKIIIDTLNTSVSIRKAAKLLSISHTALLNKIKKYAIQMETKQTSGNNSYH